MYLAEDRILCFELIARKGCRWTLHYVKDARAETDVPMTIVALIQQRRRWLNGSFFAILYMLLNVRRFYWESSHPISRKLFMSFQILWTGITVVLNFCLLSLFYLTFYYVRAVKARDHFIFLLASYPSAASFDRTRL